MSSMNLDQQVEECGSEQLYLDARLEFALIHPLDWQRLQTPVSSPAYHANRVNWKIIDSQKNSYGEMLITSLPADQSRSLQDLLESVHPRQSGEAPEHINLPAGPALQYQKQLPESALLTTAIKGLGKDFIVDFTYPASRSEQLLPIFQRVLDSFQDLSHQPDQN